MTAELNLKNQFLLAMPGLTGSYFGDTVTYICEHNAQGALGLMINRPSDVSLKELLAQLGIDAGVALAQVPVMVGGPVSPERGFVLHSLDSRFEASLDLGDGLMLSSAREVLEAIAVDDGPAEYLVTLGYAGWDSGQLEREFQENAWLNCPAEHRIIFHTPFQERVASAAEVLGIDFRLMSGQAGHD